MQLDEQVSPEDCGCAPTPREQRALRNPMSRRMALGLGGVGILSLGALGLTVAPTAFAADYPSWDDVQRAKNNEAAKASEVSRIEGLIASLQADVAAKQAEAERLAGEYLAAQEATRPPPLRPKNSRPGRRRRRPREGDRRQARPPRRAAVPLRRRRRRP